MDAFLFEAGGARVVVLVERNRPEDLEREPYSPAVLGVFIEVEAFFAAHLGLRVRALVDGEIARPGEGPRAQRCGNPLLGHQPSLKPAAALGEAAPCAPVEPEAGGDSQGSLRIVTGEAAVESRSKVRDLSVDQI